MWGEFCEDYKLDKKESCKQCKGECFNCLWDKDDLCLEIRKELDREDK